MKIESQKRIVFNRASQICSQCTTDSNLILYTKMKFKMTFLCICVCFFHSFKKHFKGDDDPAHFWVESIYRGFTKIGIDIFRDHSCVPEDHPFFCPEAVLLIILNTILQVNTRATRFMVYIPLTHQVAFSKRIPIECGLETISTGEH